ncbi:hypothetical protein E2C01_014482 [Portunus trituberculatus]|uniref:Uncharacterized protein n=1 Tax=Portunus trituberculatus TaxID=210409 RepID=A0A5B7DIY4_PORTR|nr:hypothetical protein [Portunus trituberculatus]
MLLKYLDHISLAHALLTNVHVKYAVAANVPVTLSKKCDRAECDREPIAAKFGNLTLLVALILGLFACVHVKISLNRQITISRRGGFLLARGGLRKPFVRVSSSTAGRTGRGEKGQNIYSTQHDVVY